MLRAASHSSLYTTSSLTLKSRPSHSSRVLSHSSRVLFHRHVVQRTKTCSAAALRQVEPARVDGRKSLRQTLAAGCQGLPPIATEPCTPARPRSQYPLCFAGSKSAAPSGHTAIRRRSKTSQQVDDETVAVEEDDATRRSQGRRQSPVPRRSACQATPPAMALLAPT